MDRETWAGSWTSVSGNEGSVLVRWKHTATLEVAAAFCSTWSRPETDCGGLRPAS